MSCCDGRFVDWHSHARGEQRAREYDCTLVVTAPIGDRTGWLWRAITLAGTFEGQVEPGPNAELIARNMATWAARSAITLDHEISTFGGRRL